MIIYTMTKASSETFWTWQQQQQHLLSGIAGPAAPHQTQLPADREWYPAAAGVPDAELPGLEVHPRASWNASDFRGPSTMEPPQGPRRRAGSLDRTRDPRRDSDTWDCRCLSLPATPSKRALRRTASEGARRPESPAPAAEAQGATATALSPEESKEFLPREQRSPQDAKKDKAQRWAQQGWLKTLLNIFLRTGLEEPKEKASRRAKGKDGPSQPAETPEAPGELASRKKAHDRKASRKKHGHKKRSAEEARGAPEQEVGGWEAGLPAMAAAVWPEEADLGPARGGGVESDLHWSLCIEGEGAGVSEVSSQDAGLQREEDLAQPDQDACIQMIVEFLKKVGDQWEEEQLQGPKLEAAPQNPSPALRRKSQRKKSGLKRAFSLKKHGSEEAKRAGAADFFSAESRPPRRPNFLPLCVGGQRPSTSGSFGEFTQKITALLQDPEEQEGEKQLQVQQPEVAVENLGLACRKKSQEKKSNFRRAFSQKKYGFKEPKRAGAAHAASPESRPPKRPSFLPLCVGGQRPSSSSSLDLEDLEFQESSPAEGGPARSSEAPSQARSHKPEGGPQPDGASESKELIVQKLVALLQEAGGQLGEEIGRHPSLKRYSCKLSDSSLRKLAAALGSREAQSTAPHRNLAEGSYQFAFGLANTFAGNNSHTVLSLRGLHFSCHSYTHFPHGEAPQNIASPEIQSPD
ncbi:protein BNIP5 isoform X2 [Equus caballus]|uniref:protein BNIP5 isoform X2 n=1 Tax=Equus caballus TaxID=9796 RepID=UPI0038B339CC